MSYDRYSEIMYEDQPDDDGETFAVTFLTSTNLDLPPDVVTSLQQQTYTCSTTVTIHKGSDGTIGNILAALYEALKKKCPSQSHSLTITFFAPNQM
jgi:hypothetical protein